MKKNTILYIIWAVLYCACVGFSFISEPTAGERVFLIVLSAGFFVPPYALVYESIKKQDRKAIKTLRLICICVLVLALILLVLNILSVNYSARTGLVLYVLLAMFAPPLACAEQYALSLFLWACLMMLTLQRSSPYQK